MKRIKILEAIRKIVFEQLDLDAKEEVVFNKTLSVAKNTKDIGEDDLKKIAKKVAEESFTQEDKKFLDDGDIELVIDMVVERIKEISDKNKESSGEEQENKPEEYDLSDEDREELQNSYIEFKEEFYEKKLLANQAKLVKRLLDILRKIDKQENKEKSDALKRVDEQEEEINPPQDKLDTIKTAARSFFSVLTKSKKSLKTLSDAAQDGLQLTSTYKEKLLKTIEKVQEQAAVIYNDIINLMETPSEEKPESLQEEAIVDDIVDKSTRFQDAYDKVVEVLDQLIPRLIEPDSGVKMDEISEKVSQSLEVLESVIEIFPSVKTFSGEVEDLVEIEVRFTEAIRNLGFNTSNVQKLIKGQDLNQVTLSNYSDNIVEFSEELERLFGIKSKIEKKIPQVPVVEPEQEQDPAEPGEEPEDKPAGKELPNVMTELPQIRRAVKPFLFRAFSQSLGFDPNQTGESGRRLREQFNSFIRYYLMLKSSPDQLQEVGSPFVSTKAANVAGVSDQSIGRALDFLKSRSKQDYDNIVAVFKNHPDDFKKAFRLMDLYFKREKINLKPKPEDFNEILDMEFIPLQKINERKIMQKLKPLIESILKET